MRMRQDKGHEEEVRLFLQRVAQGGLPLIPFEQLDLVTRATFAVVRSAADGKTIPLDTVANAPSDVASAHAVMI